MDLWRPLLRDPDAHEALSWALRIIAESAHPYYGEALQRAGHPAKEIRAVLVRDSQDGAVLANLEVIELSMNTNTNTNPNPNWRLLN